MRQTPKDFDFTPRVKEANVELETVAWGENNGWMVRKAEWIGRRGCPDRFFFGYGKIVMIEFKKKGGKRSEHQIKEHSRLEARGLQVMMFFTSAEAIAYLKTLMQ